MGIWISLFSTLVSSVFLLSPSALAATADPAVAPASTSIQPSDFQNLVRSGVSADALRMSIKAYDWARSEGKVKNPVMTLVDFNKPSNQTRMWVIDMHSQPKIVYSGLVTHGHNSGSLYATHFSNVDNSHESSLGAMIANEPYYGKYGLSVRIDGLEKGINDNVRERDIVFHHSDYATPSYLRQKGALGRSFGCFAIDPKKSDKVFQTIKGGSFVFAYADSIKNDKNFA